MKEEAGVTHVPILTVGFAGRRRVKIRRDVIPIVPGAEESPVMYVITMRVLPNVPVEIARARGAMPHVPVMVVKVALLARIMQERKTSVRSKLAPHAVPPITRQVVNIAPTMEQRNVPVHLPVLPMPLMDVMPAQGNVVVERSVKIEVNHVQAHYNA